MNDDNDYFLRDTVLVVGFAAGFLVLGLMVLAAIMGWIK